MVSSFQIFQQELCTFFISPMPPISYYNLFDQLHILWRVQIKEPLTGQFFPPFCHFIPLRFRHTRKHPVDKIQHKNKFFIIYIYIYTHTYNHTKSHRRHLSAVKQATNNVKSRKYNEDQRLSDEQRNMQETFLFHTTILVASFVWRQNIRTQKKKTKINGLYSIIYK
jgi:hypothetical protein